MTFEKDLEKTVLDGFTNNILQNVFAKQLELITGHFKEHKTLDWETCLTYLKRGMEQDNLGKK